MQLDQLGPSQLSTEDKSTDNDLEADRNYNHWTSIARARLRVHRWSDQGPKPALPYQLLNPEHTRAAEVAIHPFLCGESVASNGKHGSFCAADEEGKENIMMFVRQILITKSIDGKPLGRQALLDSGTKGDFCTMQIAKKLDPNFESQETGEELAVVDGVRVKPLGRITFYLKFPSRNSPNWYSSNFTVVRSIPGNPDALLGRDTIREARLMPPDDDSNKVAT